MAILITSGAQTIVIGPLLDDTDGKTRDDQATAQLSTLIEAVL